MANPTANNKGSPETITAIQNAGFDPVKRIQAFGPLGWNGKEMTYGLSDSLSTKVTTSGSITYAGFAAPGTLESEDKWQCIKIDSSTGCLVSYADGNAEFDNVATDLTSLSYS